eukprot:GHRR01026892.1.p1 GENE.GHRR01026892.1~~GHRR01026892.1.p1  ORF type:complete len:237 (+),score=54.78 GHRR01026892.1:150-860(+)
MDGNQAATTVLRQLKASSLDEKQAWQRLCKEVLHPGQPFELHQQLFKATYTSWPAEQKGPAPVWIPDSRQVQETNVARFMQTFQGDPLWDSQRTGNPTADWLLLQQISCRHPEVFWSAVLRELGVGFHTPPDQMLIDNTDDPDKVQWLPGARLNIAHCALHCPKVLNPDSPAIVWADEQAPTELKYVSWAQLQQRSMHVAACVAAQYQPGKPMIYVSTQLVLKCSHLTTLCNPAIN